MSGGPATYLNPVYPAGFPDPFVLKHQGEYWAYGTGFWPDGRCFGVLRSADLVEWVPQAGALAPLPGGHTCYWAPEVVYDNGRFYLYYSVGNEERMEIRVAVAGHPGGPFEDSGRRLTSEPFAIDAHVFADASGARWLFYATDFLDRSHVGTGTVMDRLLDPFTLAGEPRPVSLPRHDWHLYHPNRPEKGGARWHTVEGSFVLERKGRYYQMFSGGNWQNPTYGVSYAVTDRLDRAGEWDQPADGERVLPILRSGGEVVGPGHNSVVRGPDNRELYCVYHRWSSDTSARVIAIDPLDWAGDRLLVLGPSTTPRPAPLRPAVEIVAPQPFPKRLATGSPSFLMEGSLRALEILQHGIVLSGAGGERLRFLMGSEARISWRERGVGKEESLALPPGFDPLAVHLVRLEVDGTRVALDLDGVSLRWRGEVDGPVDEIAFVTEGGAELSGLALTVGWEELFQGSGSPGERGWEILAGESGSARIDAGRLWLRSRGGPTRIARGPELGDYLLVVNARFGAGGIYEVSPALPGDGSGPRVTLAAVGEGWGLAVTGGGGESILPLPASFDPAVDQQLRFRKEGGRIGIEWEGLAVGDLEAPAGPTRVGLGVEQGEASFEAVRVTAINP